MEHVNPDVARKGLFLKSFPVSQYEECLDYCYDTEMAMARHRITNKKVVFTRIGKGAQLRKWDTWQVFLIESE